MQPIRGNLEANLSKILEFLKDREKELVIFPELATSGYLLREEELPHVSLSADSPLFNEIRELAGERELIVVLGFSERKGDKYYNSAAVISPQKVEGVYRKVHLFGDEFDLFEKGDEFKVFPLRIPGSQENFNLGVMICFDWVFPESARTLALKGAHLIAHPANLVLPYCPQVMPWRALENRVFTATADRVGEDILGEKKLKFIGKSIICSPKAEILLMLSESQEQVGSVLIDPFLAEEKNLTPRNHLFRDRRPDVYALA